MKHLLLAAAALAALTSPSQAETIAITGGKQVALLRFCIKDMW